MIRGLIRSHFRLIGGLLAIRVLFQGQVVAQDDPNEKHRIYDGVYPITSMKWANDSRFVYQENNQQTGVRTGGVNNWHQYVVSTQQDIVSDFWLLQPLLTTDQP